jgi:hypothetical protein
MELLRLGQQQLLLLLLLLRMMPTAWMTQLREHCRRCA